MTSHRLSLRELFEIASDLPLGERAGYLDTHCDAELRARLERMLASDPGPQGALPGVPAAIIADALADRDDEAPAPLTGTHIGPFELVSVLGEGGSSTVFHAVRTLDGVRQDVALKLLRRGLYSVEAKRQFRRERLALSRLQHPGIARLIEGGVTETGFAYIALELVRGVPITEYARTQRLGAPARLRIFLDVCRAVAAAHRALIVHRDLKPSNVLVTTDGEMKLLDFGIAKLLGEDDGTHTGLPVFTPAYASPEQRADGLITTATDVYALGVLLGELMTGERLHEDSGRTPSGSVSNGLDAGVLPAPPAATRRLLRGDLDNIVLKALRVDPVLRYASAGHMAEDIERLLHGRPVAAHPPSRWYRTRKFVTRHKGGVLTTVVFLLAILTAFGVALWQAHVAVEQAHRADAVQAFLVDIFQANSSYQDDPVKARATTAQQLLALGAKKIDSAMTDAPDAKFKLLLLLGDMHDSLGLDEQTAALYRKAIDVAHTAYGKDAPAAFEAQIRLANILHSTHSDDEAIIVLKQAQDSLERNHDDDPYRRAQLSDQFAQYYATRDLPLALDDARKSVALYERANATFDLAFALSRKARIEHQSGLDTDAIESFQRAITISRKSDGDSNPDLLRYYAELAELQVANMDIAEGERNARRALQSAKTLHGEDHVDIVQCEMRLGRLLFDTGREQEGLALLDSAKRKVLALVGREDGFHTPQVLFQRGSLLIRMGRIEDGLNDVQAAIANRRHNRPGTIPLAQFLELAASARIEIGDFAQAARDLDEGRAIREKVGQTVPSKPFDGDIVPRIRLALAQGDANHAAELLPQLSTTNVSTDKYDLQQISDALLTAQVHLAANRLVEAAALADIVRQRIKASALAPYGQSFVATADFIEAEAQFRRGDARAAIPLLQSALLARRQALDPTSPNIAEVQIALAQSLLAAGDIAMSRALALEAAAIEAAHKDLGPQYRKPLQELQVSLARSR
jgi:tetratricopeptide (TPR) repeat protein/tRNA A-37 threonylcarbamoyl transferase component Bud32